MTSAFCEKFVSECEATCGDTSNAILFLRCDPGMNSQVFRLLLPTHIVSCPNARLQPASA